jgi:hypothetical protein
MPTFLPMIAFFILFPPDRLLVSLLSRAGGAADLTLPQTQAVGNGC